MNKIKVMTVFGTRPEAIKMAPLVHALEQNENTESIVCVTAQHREMLDQVLDIFGIRPDYDLNIMQPRQTLATITEKSLHGLDEVLEKAQPDIVLVHGDTSTTFAGALAAFYHKVPVGHVEAGLRTYDKYSPFPEEMNRKLTGQIATLHFAPTPRNRDNLAKEGITSRSEIQDLKSSVSYYQRQYFNASSAVERLQERYDRLKEKCQPFLQALEHFPKLVEVFVEKVKELFSIKEAQERKEREDRAAARKEQSKHRRGRNDWER